MSALFFIHASLWPFLLSLLIPLWLHLQRRRSVRTQVLPTFALLQTALGHQTPLMRWRRVLLLVLRLLTLLFLILAFLKPAVPAALAPEGGGRRTVIVVLDVSLSMGATNGGVSALSRAAGQTMALLDDLRRGDTANVILCGAAARPVLPKPSSDFGALRQAVRSAAPTFERGNLSAAVAFAEAELTESSAKNRELIVASDFQQTNAPPDLFAGLPAAVRLVLLEAGNAPPENAALTGMRLPAVAPIPGEAVPITAEVWNGAASSRTLAVSLEIARDDGGAFVLPAIAPQSVTVPPFAFGSAAFSVAFPDAARYRVTARLPKDALPAANRRYLLADLQDRLNVLLLTDSRFGRTDGATFLRQALNPNPDAAGGLRVTPRRPETLTAGDLRASDVVVCDELESFPPERVALLSKFLSGGGAGIFFLANPQSAAQLMALTKPIPGGRAPIQPETYLDVRRQGSGFLALKPPKTDSPLLRLFTDPAIADLTKVRFTRYFLTAPPAASAEVLLTFEDGTPALVRCDYGRGSLLIANFSASPQAGDLAQQTLFPPLIHELTQGMAARNARKTEILCGESFTLAQNRAASAGNPAASGPDGEPKAVTVEQSTGDLTVSGLARPGFYHLAAGGKTVAAFAVNPAPQESDLRRQDLRELPARRGVGASHRVGKGGQSLDSLRSSLALWPFCLLLTLLFILVEMALAGAGQGTQSRAKRETTEGQRASKSE